MNKITRLIVVALTLALLVGAVVGISASATETETEPTYEAKDLIMSYNVSYADYMHLYLAIDTSLATDYTGISATVVINGQTYTGVSVAQDNANVAIYDNVTGHVLHTPGVAPKDMLDTISITVYYEGEVTTGEGEEAVTTKVYYTDSVEYSVAQYFFERLYDNGVIDVTSGSDLYRKELYVAALRYGTAAQNLLSPEDESKIADLIYVWGDVNLGLVTKGDIQFDANTYQLQYYTLSGATGESDIIGEAGYYAIDNTVKVTACGEIWAGPDGSANFDSLNTGAVSSGTYVESNVQAETQQTSMTNMTISSLGDSKYLNMEKHTTVSGQQSWVNFFPIAEPAEGDDTFVFQARLRNYITKGDTRIRVYDPAGTNAYKSITVSSNQLKYAGTLMGVANGAWYTLRVVISTYVDETTPNYSVYVLDETSETEKWNTVLSIADSLYTDPAGITKIRIQQGASTVDTTGIDYAYCNYMAASEVADLGFGEVTEVPQTTRNADYSIFKRDATLSAGVVTTDGTTVINNSDASYDGQWELRTENGEKYLRSNDVGASGAAVIRFNHSVDTTGKDTISFETDMRLSALTNGALKADTSNAYQFRFNGTDNSVHYTRIAIIVSGGKIAVYDVTSKSTTPSTVDVGEWFTIKMSYTYTAATETAEAVVVIVDSEGEETEIPITAISAVSIDTIEKVSVVSNYGTKQLTDFKDASFSVSNSTESEQ